MTGAPAVGVAQQKTISQSSLGRHHLPGIKRLAAGGEEVFAGISHCWRFCRNKHWYSLESKLTVSAKRWITPTAFPSPPSFFSFSAARLLFFFLRFLYITVNIFLLFGSERDFSLSVNQMVSVAHKETVYRVCLLREHRRGSSVRPGSSRVCQTLGGVCLSLLGHQMGGVYGIRRYYKWQDAHTFPIKYLKVSLGVVFLIDSSPEPPHLVKLMFFLCISWARCV